MHWRLCGCCWELAVGRQLPRLPLCWKALAGWVSKFSPMTAQQQNVCIEKVFTNIQKNSWLMQSIPIGTCSQGVFQSFDWSQQICVFHARALPFRPALDVCFGSLIYFPMIKLQTWGNKASCTEHPPEWMFKWSEQVLPVKWFKWLKTMVLPIAQVANRPASDYQHSTVKLG